MAQAPGGLAFEGGTAYLLARAGAAARSRWSRMLGERGLTPHQYGIVMALAELGPTGQQQLAALIGVDVRNVVAIVDGLVAAGTVVRATDPADRRRRLLTLTEAGRAVATDLDDAGRALEDAFLGALQPDDRARLRAMLLALLG